MPTQQRLNQVHFGSLKNLKDVTIRFDESPLTALMGANGCGKTTVLHALACIYAPPDLNAPNYKLSTFFNPTRDSTWQGSAFTATYSEREGAVFFDRTNKAYAKAADRWTPRYDRRPVRFTRLITIRESVPEVEFVNAPGLVKYQRAARISLTDQAIMQAAGGIMNRNYDAYHSVTYDNGTRLSFGVTTGGLTYPALSMSAGEQRVFRILEAVITAPNYALLLIDEIDLFLHQDALSRLIAFLSQHCAQKNKQLVMTTHFPPVASMYSDVSITTLHRTTVKTISWSGYSSSALRHITGDVGRPVTVYVEDEFSYAILSQIAIELRMRPSVEIVLYGAATNAFKLAAGLALAGRPLDSVLIVLDGDLYATKSERRDRIGAELSGTEVWRARQRKDVVSKIRPFVPVNRATPEHSMHAMLHTMNAEGLSVEEQDLLEIAHQVVNAGDDHYLVTNIVLQTGEDRAVALSRLIKLVAKSDGWRKYTRTVRLALNSIRATLNIDPLH